MIKILGVVLLFYASSLDDPVNAMRADECKGGFVDQIMDGTYYQRQNVAAFLELRRRGEIPPYSVQWCIDRGIVPFQQIKDQPS